MNPISPSPSTEHPPQDRISTPDRRPAKRQKIAIACDVCRAKKVKCDGLRPICSPCAKRADRGIPCEYTPETRTNHGPSKGYVHHLESKLRKLQNSSSPQKEAPAARPQLFSAINRPQRLESSWSLAPPTTGSRQIRQQPLGYEVYEGRSPATAAATPANVVPTQQVSFTGTSDLSRKGLISQITTDANPPTAYQDSMRTQPSDLASVAFTGGYHNLAASTLRGSMAMTPVAAHSTPGRPLLLKRSKQKDSYKSSPQASGPTSYADGGQISKPPASCRLENAVTRVPSSFIHQIKSAINTRQRLPSPMLPPKVAGSSPAESPRHSTASARNLDYVLPSRKTADTLMRTYWDNVNPLFPFLNRPQFERAYTTIWSGMPSEIDETLMMCTLNVVFALSSLYSDFAVSKERESTADKFFDRAQDLLDLDLWAVGSVELVQCLLLMSQYLQSIQSFHQCWMVSGLATRVAESLGLHLLETSANVADIRQREHLRRLWHGCVLLDRILSLQFNRPAMVDKPSTKQVPFPLAVDEQYLESEQPEREPVLMSFYVSALECFEILTKALKVSTFIEEQEVATTEYRLLFGQAELANVMSVMEIDQELTSFYRKLPPYLKVVQAVSPGQNGHMLRLQANITRFRYLHCRMLLFRPILSRFCLAQNELPNLGGSFDDSLPQRMALSCSTLCLRAAHEMIAIIHNNLDSDTTYGQIPLWWNCILYVYTSATVLQAARLRGVVEASVTDFERETSFKHAIDILKSLERFESSAQRSVVALEILADKISEAQGLQRPTDPGGPTTLPTPAPSTWTNTSAGQTPMPTQTQAQTQVENELESGIQLPGFGDPFDLSEFDFDLNDLSWLMSAPVDL